VHYLLSIDPDWRASGKLSERRASRRPPRGLWHSLRNQYWHSDQQPDELDAFASADARAFLLPERIAHDESDGDAHGHAIVRPERQPDRRADKAGYAGPHRIADLGGNDDAHAVAYAWPHSPADCDSFARANAQSDSQAHIIADKVPIDAPDRAALTLPDHVAIPRAVARADDGSDGGTDSVAFHRADGRTVHIPDDAANAFTLAISHGVADREADSLPI